MPIPHSSQATLVSDAVVSTVLKRPAESAKARIAYSVDFNAKTIHTTAIGSIGYADIVNHLKGRESAQLLGYAELFDARNVTLDLSLRDIHGIGDEIRHLLSTKVFGRVAVVTNNTFLQGLIRAYADLAFRNAATVKIFGDIGEARAWSFQRQA